ncbi:hypothetical protein F4804DRAFT_322863 [Jackrogersella minutella]|nr:hypothetical protein F4804DRAFT_322863 [Jackrogersella minutella]
MGIKGIYKEIGTGRRISLTKLAVETLEETGRPLRLAIDISIWQFQVQAAKGGSNPAIRTLFYRLLRLLGLSIQPIFVFDGPNKPAFKRNKRSGRGDGVATSMAKRLIRLFGFQAHDAPGEAEAECALLQQSGIVDAVLSEDVDTIMFGCTRTLRNWSSEGKGSKTPTHVSMYDTESLQKSGAGLDREGMVLVALMSGGDYLPEGIPGAGVKLACEAARAGFGKSLCRLKKADTSELASWKEWLTFELRHNESGFFRTRHKALNVPDSFPNFDILGYYTHPVVSRASTLDRLRSQPWDKSVDVQGLREFVRETFDWNYRIGAIKFIRVLAPCLLVRKMMSRSSQDDGATKDVEILEKEESELVKSITTKRSHFSTDATPELRISFIPTKVVGYDFQDEPDEVIEYGRDGLALNSDDEFEPGVEDEGADTVTKSGSRKPFSPTEPDLSWIPETIGKLGIPVMVEDWEEAQRTKVAARQRPKASKQKGKPGAMSTNSLDKFVRVTKNIPQSKGSDKDITPTLPKPLSPTRARTPSSILTAPSQILPTLPPPSQAAQKTRPTRSSKQTKPKSKTRNASPASRPDPRINPWTIAGSQTSPRVNKIKSTKAPETITISSSPPTSPTAGIYSSIRRTDDHTAEDSSSKVHSSPPTSPHKRRSVTPTTSSQEGSRKSARIPAVRNLSPSPKSSEKKPQRKLARTESMPVAQESPTGSKSRVRQFTRAQTVAVEVQLISESEDDDNFDLPPLSSIAGGLPKGDNPFNSPSLPNRQEPASKLPGPTKPKPAKQTTLDNNFGTTKRTTKVYVPRRSEPGFFKELEVDADEADDMLTKARGLNDGGAGGGRSAAWRRSDLSCIDLTGED